MNYVNVGPMPQNLFKKLDGNRLASRWCTAVLGRLAAGALQPSFGWPLGHGSLGLAAKWCNAVLCWLAAGALQPFVCWPLVHCSLAFALHWAGLSTSLRTASRVPDFPELQSIRQLIIIPDQ